MVFLMIFAKNTTENINAKLLLAWDH